MANQEHLDILKQGVEVWNKWREEYPDTQPNLSGVDLSCMHLEKADLREVHLERAKLCRAHLEGADLREALLESADLTRANLARAKLGLAFFDSATRLNDITLADEKQGVASLVDVHWNGANLSTIDWTKIDSLGDEYESQQSKQLNQYKIAARTNRQLAVALEEQGLNAYAAPFAYRARKLDQQILPLQTFQRLRHRQEHRWLLHLLKPGRRQFYLHFRAISLTLLSYLLLVFFTLANFGLLSPGLQVALIIVDFFILPGVFWLLFRRPIARLLLLIVSIFLILIAGFILLQVLLFYSLLLLTLPFLPVVYQMHLSVLLTIILPIIPPLFLTLLAYFILRLQYSWLKPFKQQTSRLIQYLKQLLLLLLDTLKDCGQLTFSLFLDKIAGYGYKPLLSFRAYGIVIVVFATAYFTVGLIQAGQLSLLLHHPVDPIFSPLGALVFSITSFHGRGFFPSEDLKLDNIITVIAAIEAFVGLIIEVSLIAAFTQRFLGK